MQPMHPRKRRRAVPSNSARNIATMSAIFGAIDIIYLKFEKNKLFTISDNKSSMQKYEIKVNLLVCSNKSMLVTRNVFAGARLNNYGL